ncbi:MAG: PKD domain-containing protein [Bacteroidetes bacterium]|nr:PKD domain-containing protein [Bacteroidota bacterium]
MKKLLLNVLVVFALLIAGHTGVFAQGVYNISTTSTTDTSGTLYDSGGPTGDYVDNEDFEFLIQPSCATSITLNITAFESESSFDYLYVYDGTTTSGTLLVTANGQTLPSPSTVTATSGSMLVVWHSDVSVTYPGFECNWTSVIAPSVAPDAGFIIGNSNPPLGVNVAFTDTSVGGPTAWLWDFGDGDTARSQNPLHTFAAPGTYTITLVAFTCNESDTMIQTLTVQGPPEISVAQTGFSISAACGDSVAFPLDISNIAGGELVYTVDGSNVGDIKVLAMTYGADLFAEYPSMINAINQYFTAYTLTTTATTNPGTLNSLLIGQNVLLIPEQETGVPSTWTAMAPVIQQFLNNGGSVIFIGSYSSESDCMFNTGVFSGTYAQDEFTTFTNVTVDDPAHPLVAGIGVTSFSPPSATFSMNLTNTDRVQVVSAGGRDVVSYRYYGSGKAIFIAFDYFSPSVESSQIIANAIQWGGENALPSWISVAPTTDTVGAGNTSNAVVTFQTTGLPAGTYYANLGVASNDPVTPIVLLPCTLTVSGFPIVGLSEICLNYDSVMQNTSVRDTFQVINNGCDTLFVSSITSNSPEFVVTSGVSYLLPGGYADVVITFSSGTVGSFTGTISIQNNDIDTSVCLTASAFPAPILVTSTNSITQALRACGTTDSLVVWLYNTGGSNLTYNLGNLAAWVTANPTSGVINVGDSVGITLVFSSGTLAGGNQTSSLIINTNDPLNLTKSIPLTLAVDFNPCMDYTFTSNTCNGSSIFATTQINTPDTYHWDFGDGDTSNVQNPTHYFPANGTYTVTLIACNAAGCDTVVQSLSAVITGPRATTCYPATLAYCCGIGVTNFTFGISGGPQINNNSNDAVDGYVDYTCAAPNTFLTNYPYNISVSTGFTYAERVKIWLDLNDDGTLDPVTELIFSDSALTTHTGTYSIPDVGTVLGSPLRMRVATDYVGNASPTPCLDLQFGQIEDYSIFVSFYDGIEQFNREIGFTVYPNPYDQSASIEYNLKNTSKVSVEVYNMMGSIVHSFAAGELQSAGKHTYNFSGNASGVYYVKVTADGKTAVQKIVKM